MGGCSRERHNRKEVKTMKYEKPEIITSSYALSTVHGAKDSPMNDGQGHEPPVATAAAYQADE
jgi:hypothetical protein